MPSDLKKFLYEIKIKVELCEFFEKKYIKDFIHDKDKIFFNCQMISLRRLRLLVRIKDYQAEDP